MSTALANPAEMIRKGAPRLIHSDEELREYTQTLFALTAKPDPTPEEEEAIELLTLLIERYETEHYPVPDAAPVDVLRFLLDRNGLSQRGIASELGSESTVSLVLAGKRRLNRNHIERLCRRFHVSPSVFFDGIQEKTEKRAHRRNRWPPERAFAKAPNVEPGEADRRSSDALKPTAMPHRTRRG
jgi:HTH-type transcriptional regulator/antitoxin HigA